MTSQPSRIERSRGQAGRKPQYRKWIIDHVEEMSQPEKDSVDAARLQAQYDEVVEQLDRTEEILRAVVRKLE